MNQLTTANRQMLRLIFVFTVSFGLLIFLGSLYYFGSARFAGGVLAGTLLSLANLFFLTKIVVKVLDQHYKRRPIIALYFIAKLLFVLVVLTLSFWVFKFEPKGFAAGYFSLVLAILVSQFFGLHAAGLPDDTGTQLGVED